MVTLNDAVATFPNSSAASQVTVVKPTGNKLPDDKFGTGEVVHVTVTGSVTSSVAVTEYSTRWGVRAGDITISLGLSIVGALLSTGHSEITLHHRTHTIDRDSELLLGGITRSILSIACHSGITNRESASAH